MKKRKNKTNRKATVSNELLIILFLVGAVLLTLLTWIAVCKIL